VHSGDSACAIPPQTLPSWVVEVMESYVGAIAERLDVRGLINVQFAVAGTTVYVIEANPRASRTVPFVAKATGVPLAKVATRVMLGATLAELRAEGLLCEPVGGHVAVKEAVMPFNRFPEVDPALGPEMRSTGEVMGIDTTFGRAFFKAELAAGTVLPAGGTVFLSLADPDKPAGLVVAKRLRALGMSIAATEGTAAYLATFGEPVEPDRRQGAGRSCGHRRRSDRRRQRELRREHTARARRAYRRRADPQGGEPSPGQLRHHDRCGARGSAGHGRAGRRRPRRPLTAGIPRPREPGRVMTLDTRVTVGSVELRNPIMTASGTAGYSTELSPYLDLASLGAVVVKSLAAYEWPGNPAPRLHPTPQGMINAVGLQGPGVEAWMTHGLPELLATGATVVASIWGRSLDDYRRPPTCWRRPHPRWWPSRSTCRARTSRAATPSSPTIPNSRPRSSQPPQPAGAPGGRS
jgi:hypothetical protein